MKKASVIKKMLYVILFFVCLYLLGCKLMYDRGKTVPDSERDERTTASDENNIESAVIEDAESESEDIIAKIAYERARSIDFAAGEYMLDTEVYNKEMNEEYKEAFLQVLFNRMPIQYESGEEAYFEEISSNLTGNSDEDYIKILKKAFTYYYLDFDGDGLPELIIESRLRDVRFGGPRIWKYDADSKRVYNLGEYRWTGWKPLGAGKLYYEDQSSAGLIKYGYQEINPLGDTVREVDFCRMFQGSLNTEQYTISVDELEDVEIDKESWDEITHDFFEATDNAVTEVTFDELFSDIEHP